jgi:small subunit ribosomal protein S5
MVQVIAGGAVRSVLESVGIHDVLSKSRIFKSQRKATLMLLQMRSAYTVAKQRGVSLGKVLKVNSRKLWLNYCKTS